MSTEIRLAERWKTPGGNHTYSIREAVEREAKEDHWDDERVRDAHSRIDKALEFIGRTLSVLVDKGLLSKEDLIGDILTGYKEAGT